MSDADLIECIQQFDVVWNKKNPNYKNKLVVKNSWNTIGEALNLSAEVCERRFANIRHRYAKERRILLDNTHSGAGAYVSKWPHFEACSFLNNVIATRATRTNFLRPTMTNFQKATSTDSSADNLRVSTNAKFSTRICQTRETASKCSNEATMDVIPEGVLQSKYDKVIRLVISKLIQLTSRISGAFNKFENVMKSSQQCDELPAELSDEDFAFGRTVALALKNISSNKKKLILKAKIINDIANATDD